MATYLDERTVAALPAPSRGTSTIWDTKVAGFGVRVSPSGGRSFFFNYKSPEGLGERRITIGAHPTWSAAEARREAVVLRKQVDRAIDPREVRRNALEAPTVNDLAERYKLGHLTTKAARSVIEDTRMIDREILPRLGARKVADVHHGDIKALHVAIGTRINPKTKKGCTGRANRVLALLSKMFSISLIPIENERVAWRDQRNPCKGIERYVERGKTRFLSPAEVAALADAIAVRGKTPATNAVRLIMLTGCRPGEAMAATWEEFDADPGVWTKPSAHTKQREEHRVTLSAGARALIEQVRADRALSPRTRRSPYVFPGEKEGAPLKQLHSTWKALSEFATVSLWRDHKDPKIAKLIADLEAGLARRPTVRECRSAAALVDIKLPAGLTDARLYDLRHTFASIGVGGGVSLYVVGALLGHTQARTTQRYAHLADDAQRAAADKIDAVLSGAGSVGADVTQLRKA